MSVCSELPADDTAAGMLPGLLGPVRGSHQLLQDQRCSLLVSAAGLDGGAHQAGGSEILGGVGTTQMLRDDVIKRCVLGRDGLPAVATAPPIALEQRPPELRVAEVIRINSDCMLVGFDALADTRNLTRQTDGVRRPESVRVANWMKPASSSDLSFFVMCW